MTKKTNKEFNIATIESLNGLTVEAVLRLKGTATPEIAGHNMFFRGEVNFVFPFNIPIATRMDIDLPVAGKAKNLISGAYQPSNPMFSLYPHNIEDYVVESKEVEMNDSPMIKHVYTFALKGDVELVIRYYAEKPVLETVTLPGGK